MPHFIFLVGFMGSGKTAVGRELASRLGWDFIDLDSLIERREHSTIADIFRTHGEPAFRQAEIAALGELLGTPRAHHSVVALGGGAFAQDENRDLLQSHPTVFLEAPVEELWRRSGLDAVERPLRQDRAQFESLYRQRLLFYRQASLTVHTEGKEPAAICLEIEKALGLERA
jgi:shikimate kinase